MQKQQIQLFRSITQDTQIHETQILKFFKWSNGDIQQALNYYYRKKEKGKINSSEKKVIPSIFNSFKNKKQDSKSTRSQSNPSQTQLKNNDKIEVQVQKQESLVFVKMRNASIKQKKVQQFIARVRKQYQLPIKGKKNKPIDKQKLISLEDDEYLVQQEYECADYLPSVFNQIVDQNQEEEKLQENQQKNDIQIEKLSMNQNSSQFKLTQSMQQYLLEDEQPEKAKQLVKPICRSKPAQKNLNKSLPKFEMYSSKQKIDLNQSLQNQNGLKTINQVYLGEYFFTGFKTDDKKLPQFRQCEILQYKYYTEPQKKKKTFKSTKKIQPNINMRIIANFQQICRIDDHEARILVPLITQKIIRLEVQIFDPPPVVKIFAKFKLLAKVFLLKKAITEPVVETFDGQSQQVVSIYKGIREQLTGLLQRLNLKVLTHPLIKNKSRFSKKQNVQRSSKCSDLKFKQKSLQFKMKEEQYIKRKQNDPFFKQKQVSLHEMMKNNESTSTQTKKHQHQLQRVTMEVQDFKQEKFLESAVKRKIIEVNTIEENKYAQLIDLYEQDLIPIYPIQNFRSELYHYQAIALSWMLKREGLQIQETKAQKQIINQQIHPLWTQYLLPQGKSLYFNQLTAQTCLKRPEMQVKCIGGILADEMGLGKTVMMAALMSYNIEKQIKKNQGYNLVIVPLTLLSQWQSEIKKHTKELSVLCYYTSQRKKYEHELNRFNVVITTYGTISHQFTKMTKFSKVGLYKYKWKRIILDQAHYIKGRIIQTSKAVYTLQGNSRWCLTGTPIQNGLNDLFSLIHFIKYSPWGQFQCWSKYIIKPHEEGDAQVYDVLKNILKRVFLRRTKASKDQNGKNIIELPKKHSKIQLLEMSPKQRQFYDMVYDSSKAKIDQLDKLGIISAKYMQVLQILIKLRQVCCHPVLFKSVTKFIKNPQQFQNQLIKFVRKRQSERVKENEQQNQNYYQPVIQGEQQVRVQIAQENTRVSQSYLRQILKKISNDDIQNCLICLDNVQQPVITSCLHIFCKPCMIRQLQQFGNCATCRKRITKQDYLHLPRQNRFNTNLDSPDFIRSTKMIALMDHLKAMASQDKAVIFSQFLGMLDLIEHDLQKNKFSYVRMQGSTPQKERAKIISQFSSNPKVKIFLVSLKTAGVGLNLVAANKVFLVDPWWNPGVQQQAIQRVHRIGQKKQVQVIRFIMDKSIQMRMVELNNNKKNLSNMVLSHKQNDTESKLDKLRYLMEKY